MKFTIYGSGCAKCKQLASNLQAAAQAAGVAYELDKVTDVNNIIDAGVMRTPALAVNGDIVLEGKVASANELAAYLRAP